MVFKFNLGQAIYYMRNNAVYSAPVLSRMVIENQYENLAITHEQKEKYTPWGCNRKVYHTLHGDIDEYKAFGSKEELLASL